MTLFRLAPALVASFVLVACQQGDTNPGPQLVTADTCEPDVPTMHVLDAAADNKDPTDAPQTAPAGATYKKVTDGQSMGFADFNDGTGDNGRVDLITVGLPGPQAPQPALAEGKASGDMTRTIARVQPAELACDVTITPFIFVSLKEVPGGKAEGKVTLAGDLPGVSAQNNLNATYRFDLLNNQVRVRNAAGTVIATQPNSTAFVPPAYQQRIDLELPGGEIEVEVSAEAMARGHRLTEIEGDDESEEPKLAHDASFALIRVVTALNVKTPPP